MIAFNTNTLPTGRVHYTLPGYQPELTPTEDNGSSERYTFRDHLPALQHGDFASWRQVLALDQAPHDPCMFAAPPLVSRHSLDPIAERQQWQRLLSRGADPESFAGMPPAVGQMFALLREYQKHEATLLSYEFGQGSP